MKLKTDSDYLTETANSSRLNKLGSKDSLSCVSFNFKTSSREEAQIWIDFKNGERKALSIIYQTNIKMLLQYGQKFNLDKNIIADLIQDLFIELWNQRERLSETTSIKFYLLKSLRYKIIRYLNRNKDVIIKNEISDNYNFELVYSHEDKLIEDALIEEQKEKLAWALTNLTKRQKEAIYLRYYNSLSYPEISSLMQLSEQATYNLVSKAIKVLQKQLLHHAYLLLLVYCFT